jgi:putative PIG3 family NAD(P)H quinone oxidoreductase
VRAITIPAPGELEWTEVPEPVVGQGQVLIEVAAAGLNRADLLQVGGHYPPPPGAPPYPGLEVSGTTPDGKQVCALLGGGGYAERVAVHAEHLLPVPEGVSLRDAASLPEAACTVWSNLTMVAGLQAGETVLIHGGGSGIGTFAIQYAKALGAYVIATARGFKHKALKDLGADETVDYTTDDWSATVRADVILDIMGASYLERNLKALNTNGRLVIIALQGGAQAEINLGAVMRQRLTVAGTTLRARPDHEKTKIVQGVRREVWPLIGKAIKPVIDRVFPLSQAAEAQQLMASNQHVGKVLLLPG